MIKLNLQARLCYSPSSMIMFYAAVWDFISHTAYLRRGRGRQAYFRR